MYMSQEMLKLRRFLARFWLSDNQMTIIINLSLCSQYQGDDCYNYGSY